MLEIQKKVIKGVSSDKDLFKKELIKSYVWLNNSEIEELKDWVIKEFNSLYPDVINEIFQLEYHLV